MNGTLTYVTFGTLNFPSQRSSEELLFSESRQLLAGRFSKVLIVDIQQFHQSCNKNLGGRFRPFFD